MGYQRFAPVFLRIGLAFVFLLFGIQKLTSSGQATAETQLLTNFELADAAAVNFYLSLIELGIAISFIVGFKVRIFSFISSLLVTTFFVSFLTKYGVSLNPDLYRDIGLLGASIALFLLGSGPISIDSFFAQKKREINKYLGLLIFAVLLMSSGIFYQKFYRPASIGNFKSTGNEVEIHMRVVQNKWKWQVDTIQVSSKGNKGPIQEMAPIPSQASIRVQPGDKIKLYIFNEDTYDHGFAIDVLGVNRRLFPKSETVIEFTPSLAGKFNFYCSVPCGAGHYDQVGTLVVGKGDGAGVILSMINKENFACEK